MKTTDHTSERIAVAKSPDPRWYRVRPTLLCILAVSVAAWLGVLGYEATRGFGSWEFLETATRLVPQDAAIPLDMLAAVAVAAVIVEGVRTSRRLRKLRRKLVRSMRVTQRLVLGSRTV